MAKAKQKRWSVYGNPTYLEFLRPKCRPQNFLLEFFQPIIILSTFKKKLKQVCLLSHFNLTQTTCNLFLKRITLA